MLGAAGWGGAPAPGGPLVPTHHAVSQARSLDPGPAPPPSAIAPLPRGSGWLAAAAASGDTDRRVLRNYWGVALLRRKVFSEPRLGVSSCDRTAPLGCRHSWRERPGPGPRGPRPPQAARRVLAHHLDLRGPGPGVSSRAPLG